MNTYLKIALVLLSLMALGLVALNFHTAVKATHRVGGCRGDRPPGESIRKRELHALSDLAPTAGNNSAIELHARSRKSDAYLQ
jgi:hypothetical protein